MVQETKERLEERLRGEGWEFLERRSVIPTTLAGYDLIPFGRGHLMVESHLRLTDEQLLEEYRKDFKDVLVTDAYDEGGRVHGDMRDVYVRYGS